jgi:hypothetical protein
MNWFLFFLQEEKPTVEQAPIPSSGFVSAEEGLQGSAQEKVPSHHLHFNESATQLDPVGTSPDAPVAAEMPSVPRGGNPADMDDDDDTRSMSIDNSAFRFVPVHNNVLHDGRTLFISAPQQSLYAAKPLLDACSSEDTQSGSSIVGTLHDGFKRAIGTGQAPHSSGSIASSFGLSPEEATQCPNNITRSLSSSNRARSTMALCSNKPLIGQRAPHDNGPAPPGKSVLRGPPRAEGASTSTTAPRQGGGASSNECIGVLRHTIICEMVKSQPVYPSR